jgi:hypothetical protein
MWLFIKSLASQFGLEALRWLAIAGTVTAILLGARKAGRDIERLEQLKHDQRIRDRQLRAAASRPATRDELSHSLQDGSF